MAWAIALCMAFVGFDVYISHRRIKAYGPFAELNPLVRQLIADFGLKFGLGIGAFQGLATVGVLAYFRLSNLLWLYCGVKLGLVLMQLKSLQMESFIEKVLFKAREKVKARELGPPSA